MTIISDSPMFDVSIDDDELAELALGTDPDIELGVDAMCLWDLEGFAPKGQLPSWYMSAPMVRTHVVRGWRRRAIVFVIAAFLTIDMYGLCNTYGDLRVVSTHAQP